MRARLFCPHCRVSFRLTKTGALPPHTWKPPPLTVIIPHKPLTEEIRDALIAEVKKWLNDLRYIAITPIPNVSMRSIVADPRCPMSLSYDGVATLNPVP